MTQKYSNLDHMLKFDDDMRIIEGIMKNIWCDEFNKKATKLDVADKKLLADFTEKNKRTAYSAYCAWEDENGGEPKNSEEFDKQSNAVIQAVQKAMKPK